MPEEDPDFDKYWQETMGDVEPNPDKSNRSCWWYLDPGESITVTIASGLVSDETVAKVLDGTWTLAIQPIPKGGSGRAYTGPGKLGQEDQIDPEILNFDNDEKYVQTTYIKLPITKNSIRDQ